MDEDGRGFFENAVGLRRARRLHRGAAGRAGGRRHLPGGGRAGSPPAPSPTRAGASPRRAPASTWTTRSWRRTRSSRSRALPVFYLPYSTTRSAGTAAPRASSSRTSATRPTGASPSAPASSGRWAAAWTRPSTPTTTRRSATASATSCATRWASPSRGTFRTYVFAVDGADALDYDLDWNALQMLPGKVRATVNVRQYSDILFHQRYQDNFNRVTNRTQRWSGSLEKDLKLAVLSAYADTTSTYFGDRLPAGQRPAARHLACAASRARSAGAGSWSASRRPRSGSSTETPSGWTTGRASTSRPRCRGPSA